MKNYKNYLFENNILAQKLIDADDERVMKKLLGNPMFYSFEFKKLNNANHIQIRVKEGELNSIFGLGDEYLEVRDYIEKYNECINQVDNLYNTDRDTFKNNMNEENIGLINKINYLFHSNTFIYNLTSFSFNQVIFGIGLKLSIVIEDNHEKKLHKNAMSISDKLDFDISVDNDRDDYILITFNLNKLPDGKSLYDVFLSNADALREMKKLDDNIKLDKEEIKKYNKELKPILESALNYFKKHRDDIIFDIDIDKNNLLIHMIGGDFIKNANSFEYQDKYINDNVDKYKKMISNVGSGEGRNTFKINDKIKEKYAYLLDMDKFNI